MVTGKIVQSTLEECREAYEAWIGMVLSLSLFFLFWCWSAVTLHGHTFSYLYIITVFQAHDLLKQKNLEKQEG